MARLDISTQTGNRKYQTTLSMIFLKAMHDLYGDVEIQIANSLNKGLFVKVRREMTDEDVLAVEERMREIIALDLPITKEGDIYTLDDFSAFFYARLAMSTGPVDLFEVVKYKDALLLRFPRQSDPEHLPPYVDEKRMYEAFIEAARWSRITRIEFVDQLNSVIERGYFNDIMLISEALHEKSISELADNVKKSKARIVLIAGPSSSGKTTFAKRLCIQLYVLGLRPKYMGMDDYFKDREFTPKDENGEYDFENIGALDLDLFNSQMNELLAGKEVDMPVFDFVEGKKKFGQHLMTLEENSVLVIEGIHALNPKMTEGIPSEEKFKVYISPLTSIHIDKYNRIPTTDNRLLRRIVRDNRFRGRNPQETIAEWSKVRAGEEKNIFPYNGEADAFFNSAHIYEMAVLKKYAMPLLADVGEDEPEYDEAQRLIRFLRFFKAADDDSKILGNSIIREFIGGSIFAD